jgi:uncharacterized repeat protein (TIGR03803 family)
LYGTTTTGGGSGCGGQGCGTVFEISTAGKESVVYAFKGGSDGAVPEAALVNANNALYGTTAYGGTGGCKTTNEPNGCGTVYKITL